MTTPEFAYRKGGRLRTHQSYGRLKALQERRVKGLEDFARQLNAELKAYHSSDNPTKAEQTRFIERLRLFQCRAENTLDREAALAVPEGHPEYNNYLMRSHGLKGAVMFASDVPWLIDRVKKKRA